MKINEITEVAKRQGSYADRHIFYRYGKLMSDECFIISGDDKQRISVKQYNKLKDLKICECKLKYL